VICDSWVSGGANRRSRCCGGGEAYSQDLRERVIAAADDGVPVGRIAVLLRVSVSYVSKVLSRQRETGETTARAQRCHLVPKLRAWHDAIRERAAARPDATIAELRAWLLETHKVSASEGLMCETLAQLDLTLKKSRCGPASRIAPTLPRRGQCGGRSNQR